MKTDKVKTKYRIKPIPGVIFCDNCHIMCPRTEEEPSRQVNILQIPQLLYV